MTNRLFLAHLHSIGFSQKSLSRIFEKEENFEDFYRRLDLSMLAKMGLKSEKIEMVLKKKEALDKKKTGDTLERFGVRLITIYDEEYPSLLRESPICPYFLYLRGTLKDMPCISVVGSRKSTSYSRSALGMIIPDLVRAGYSIASGWAYGVDSVSHSVAMEQNGHTIAVFGTGIDGCYPRENKDLFERIVSSGGALVSAFPIGTAPERYNFPIRNEIVAGISRGVLVTEAAEKSGTLITASLALDFGRDVFALPGEITKATSAGANILIRDGQAKLVMSAEDILSEYAPVEIIKNISSEEKSEKKTHFFEDALEASIYELIGFEPLDASSISDRLNTDISTIAFRLSMMEVRGLVEMGIGGDYEAR